ncbi:unnamed protein product [Cuscuta europaea]|uniref:SWIM-type domain-containing protein n=1 Tax=Cuscuta europaea TaxID=41803 RepID=A0A9P0ZCE1_CUSEU|nr:unnamed protein product [Cuscuta europaea]
MALSPGLVKLLSRWTSNLGPRILKKLNANIDQSMGWKIIFNGDDGYEVKCGSCQYKVRLHASTCSCRAWDLSGIPCPHVVYAISYKGDDAEQYVDHCNFKQVYQRIYSYHLQPMNEELLWTRTQNNDIVPPIPKKLSSRPKKKRTR